MNNPINPQLSTDSNVPNVPILPVLSCSEDPELLLCDLAVVGINESLVEIIRIIVNNGEIVWTFI